MEIKNCSMHCLFKIGKLSFLGFNLEIHISSSLTLLLMSRDVSTFETFAAKKVDWHFLYMYMYYFCKFIFFISWI